MSESRDFTDAIRSVTIGPFGPNSLDIIVTGGTLALTGREADEIEAAIRPFVVPTSRVRAAIRLLYPEEMTPTAKRVLDAILDDEEAKRD